ncbi:hypothetical protein O7621_28085 [Solwaraspora sp. WMMD937]|uniref:hypothetical protein n=1 Tax=Solwaraspora sp. WMMD937 TaxID=3016090 RepID=UPI002499EE39|nr:hypothetical protein [Solwaraspora sp. WMMD937]WFE21632.1 hypothetical protein O7621_28085 [Solwaraspora sp. WMMD937]
MSIDWVTVEFAGWVAGTLTGVLGILTSLGGFFTLRRSSERSAEHLKVEVSRTSQVVQAGRDLYISWAEDSTEDRVERLMNALRESRQLVQELEAEIDTRAAAVKRLQAEEEQNRQLAALRKEEARAVRNLVDSVITSAHIDLQRQMAEERDEVAKTLGGLQAEIVALQKKGRRDQVLFFVFGAILSIPIGLTINWVTA